MKSTVKPLAQRSMREFLVVSNIAWLLVPDPKPTSIAKSDQQGFIQDFDWKRGRSHVFSHLKILPFILCWTQLGLCLADEEHLRFTSMLTKWAAEVGFVLGPVPWGSCKISQENNYKYFTIQMHHLVSMVRWSWRIHIFSSEIGFVILLFLFTRIFLSRIK